MGPAERDILPPRAGGEQTTTATLGRAPNKNRALDKIYMSCYHICMVIEITRKQYRKLGRWAIGMLLAGGARLRVV
jgi:hypothetical protein